MKHTDLVFRDLEDSLNVLKESKKSPVDVRRQFSRFITLTQQLTEMMRKEFEELTGHKWEASEFGEWNHVTELFKKLRRTDYHESPVVINVKENQRFLVDTYQDESGEEYGEYLTFQVTWGLDDPLASDISSELTPMFFDKNKAPIDNIKPDKIDYEFILAPKTDEIKKALELACSDDIHILSEKCFETLEKYYMFYKDRIRELTKKK